MHGRGHAWWGACMVVGACMAGGMHGRRHAWQGVCMAVGACVAGGRGCAWQGACVAGGGHAWQGGACVAGGVHGKGGCMAGGHVWWGACMACMPHLTDTMRYGDTVNEWAVRILLECILVVIFFKNSLPSGTDSKLVIYFKLSSLHILPFSVY